MSGRGIDQILPHPSNPQLYEPYIKDARDYLALAELVHGKIDYPVDFSYVWGDALIEFSQVKPKIRIVNLETSITTSDECWQGKEVLYRMHPKNILLLTRAEINCAVLANNHILDWGRTGLIETLKTLEQAGIETVGAGRSQKQAVMPAVFPVAKKSRVIIYAYGDISSGIPFDWRAGENKPGVNLLTELSLKQVAELQKEILKIKQPGDLVIFSIHWGSNWGYGIPQEQREFAHLLIDQAQVDLVYGHSSHHLKAFEVYQGKLIFYGCGDFLDDYEGIGGFESFRSDLRLMYFLEINPDNASIVSLRLVPLKIQRFQLQHASRKDADWLCQVLNQQGQKFGTQVKLNQDNSISLQF